MLSQWPTTFRRPASLVCFFGVCLAMGCYHLVFDMRQIQKVLFDWETTETTVNDAVLPHILSETLDDDTNIDQGKPPQLARSTEGMNDHASCSQVNSKEWLEGERLGNVEDGFTPEMVQRMILGKPLGDSSYLLDRSL